MIVNLKIVYLANQAQNNKVIKKLKYQIMILFKTQFKVKNKKNKSKFNIKVKNNLLVLLVFHNKLKF